MIIVTIYSFCIICHVYVSAKKVRPLTPFEKKYTALGHLLVGHSCSMVSSSDASTGLTKGSYIYGLTVPLYIDLNSGVESKSSLLDILISIIYTRNKFIGTSGDITSGFECYRTGSLFFIYKLLQKVFKC